MTEQADHAAVLIFPSSEDPCDTTFWLTPTIPNV